MNTLKQITFILLVLLMGYACKDQDKMYREYAEDGEITYPCKAREVVVYAGKERVKICWTNIDPSVTGAKIYWNNYEDSVVVDIAKGTALIERIIDLPEGEYSFIIITYDAQGNASIPVEVYGRSIGDKFISRLLPRGITGMSLIGGVLSIEWDAAEESEMYSELVYTGAGNQEKTIRADASAPVTTIPDYVFFNSLRYNTVHGSETLSFDFFSTDFKLIEWDQIKSLCVKEIPKIGWVRHPLASDILGEHFDLPQFVFEKAWDGIIGADENIFLSTYVTIPWTGTIDLGKTVTISRMKLYHRRGYEYNSAQDFTLKVFECWGSNVANPGDDLEGGDWVLLAKCGPAPQKDVQDLRANGDEFHFTVTEDCNPDVPVRYFRFRLFESWAPGNPDWIGIPEMTLYGVEL